MPDVLPSVRFEADDPRPVGFVADVSDDHLAAAGSALRDVADVVRGVAGDRSAQLTVRFTSVRFTPGLPFVLYAFHVVCVDDAGVVVDEIAAGQEVSYALIANHAVEVQREAAIYFLYCLVFRQVAVAPLQSPGGPPIESIDSRVAESDRQATQEFADRMRGGWAQATRSIAQRAVAEGLTLQASYEVDVLPTRSDVVRRMPLLRRTYNEVPAAQQAIDNIVATIGGRDPRLSATDVPVAVIDKAQRLLASLNIRRWVSQTMRDAEVCGNGYLVTTSTPEPSMYALRPEAVEVVGPAAFRISESGEGGPLVDGTVLHIRGIEQFHSPYGISILEPVLAQYQSQLVMAEATRVADTITERFPPHSKEAAWAAQTRALAERTAADRDEALTKLLWFPRNRLQAARGDLYFPGQESM